MERLEHDLLPNLVFAAVILAAAIIILIFVWLWFRTFKPNQGARSPHRYRGPVYHPTNPVQHSNRSISEPEKILQIDNVLTLIEKNLWGADEIPPVQKRSGETLERILERLNQIRLKTNRSLNREFESPPVHAEPVVTPILSPDSMTHTLTTPVLSFAEEFVDMYNRARENKEERKSFWGRFQVIQIGNRNASDQRMGRTTETDFRQTDVGDFLAIQNVVTGTYLVVPHFTLVIDDTSYRYGGVEAAFDCDFSPGMSYQRFQVITPAEFVRDGDTWRRKTQGKLFFRAN